MKHIVLVLAFLSAGASAFAQSPIITNADLGRPLDPVKPTIAPDVWAGLVARQYVHHEPLPPGPFVYTIPYDGSRDILPPMEIRPLAEPFFAGSVYPSYPYLPYPVFVNGPRWPGRAHHQQHQAPRPAVSAPTIAPRPPATSPLAPRGLALAPRPPR